MKKTFSAWRYVFFITAVADCIYSIMFYSLWMSTRSTLGEMPWEWMIIALMIYPLSFITEPLSEFVPRQWIVVPIYLTGLIQWTLIPSLLYLVYAWMWRFFNRNASQNT